MKIDFVERATRAILEQRGERDTPWDLAILAAVEAVRREFNAEASPVPGAQAQDDKGCSMATDPWNQHGKDGFCVVRGEQCPTACMIGRMQRLERNIQWQESRLKELAGAAAPSEG